MTTNEAEEITKQNPQQQGAGIENPQENKSAEAETAISNVIQSAFGLGGSEQPQNDQHQQLNEENKQNEAKKEDTEINEQNRIENSAENQPETAQDSPENQPVAIVIDTKGDSNDVTVEKTSETMKSTLRPIILDENGKPVEIQDEQTTTNDQENAQPENEQIHQQQHRTKKNARTSKVMDKNSFISMLRNAQTSRPRTSFHKNSRSKSTPIASDKLPLITDNILRGKDQNITDPSQISEIIDELIGRRIKALDENDYLECNKIDEAIAKLRLKYRSNDRDELFNMIKDNLEKRRKEAEMSLNEKKDKWKQKWKDFDQEQENEKNNLHQRQVKEFEDFEAYWSDPTNYTEYTKRSKGQLNEIFVERNLAMTGRFIEAEQQKKLNQQADKKMVQEQHQRLTSFFEFKKAELISNQEKEVQKLLTEQDLKRKLMVEKENFKIGRKKKALENVTRTMEAEKKFANFCAKTYKRDPSIVLPPTVLTNPTSIDLPPMPPSKIHPRGVEDKVRISSKPQFIPLSLPQLKFKKYTVPKIDDKRNLAGTI